MIRELIPSKNEDDNSLLLRELPGLYNHPETLKFISFTLKDFKKETFEKYLKHHAENGIKYFAEMRGGKIAGLVMVAENDVSGAELSLLIVNPEFRGEGIGKKLSEYAIGFIEKKGFLAMRVAVYCDNLKMLGMMIAFGFKPFAMEYHKRDDGEDLLWLKKYFRKDN